MNILKSHVYPLHNFEFTEIMWNFQLLVMEFFVGKESSVYSGEFGSNVCGKVSGAGHIWEILYPNKKWRAVLTPMQISYSSPLVGFILCWVYVLSFQCLLGMYVYKNDHIM